jgi:hypothetical protein
MQLSDLKRALNFKPAHYFRFPRMMHCQGRKMLESEIVGSDYQI